MARRAPHWSIPLFDQELEPMGGDHEDDVDNSSVPTSNTVGECMVATAKNSKNGVTTCAEDTQHI